MKRTLLITMCLLSLLLCTSMPVTLAYEFTNWSDDFNDGNYDGWTVTFGTFSVISGKLTVTEMAPGPAFPVIHHYQSNTSFGNWSFDVEIGDDPEYTEHVVICFMRNFGGGGFLGGPTDVAIYLEFLGDWNLYKGDTLYEDFPTQREWEHHIRIQRTRAEPNSMKVYHNGTLALDEIMIVPDLNYTYFSFLGTRGASIDNIVVEYEPELNITTTTTTTTTDDSSTTDSTTTSSTTTSSNESSNTTMVLILAGGGIAVLVVIIIVIKMRK